jgi:hypothetical protein
MKSSICKLFNINFLEYESRHSPGRPSPRSDPKGPAQLFSGIRRKRREGTLEIVSGILTLKRVKKR